MQIFEIALLDENIYFQCNEWCDSTMDELQVKLDEIPFYTRNYPNQSLIKNVASTLHILEDWLKLNFSASTWMSATRFPTKTDNLAGSDLTQWSAIKELNKHHLL